MMSPSKMAEMSGWDYQPGEVIDVKVRSLIVGGATPNLTGSCVPVQQQEMSVAPLKDAPQVATNPFGGARIEPDAYHAVENYRGVSLRYCEDPKRPGAVRVYVESTIDWNGRSSSAHTTHLWPAGHDGRAHPPYICVKDEYAPKNYEAAKKGAEMWVRGTQHYIATGQTISERLARGETI